MHDRLIQVAALVIMITGASVCAAVLPRITDLTQKYALRYTDVAVEGAPPIVALGTAIGALRGIIVDYLWIKVHLMKEDGLYYEVMADADLITKLQPRFAAVWAFHGHNMAYNISVAHNTEPERWEWVKAGINLVRNKGLRYNPNDLQLHRELAFWFSHKIEGVSDDAHLYYKRELAREWHYLLGQPPDDYQERVEWIRRIADAPDTLEAAERRTPGVTALVDRLRSALTPYEQRFKFALDSTLLRARVEWGAIRGQSEFARMLGLEETTRQNPFFVAFDEIASDPQYAQAWDALLAHVRKRVLLDEYNMDPRLMYEFTRDYGPLDWRHGDAHALYFVLKGSEQGEDRAAVNVEDVYRIVNNDRTKLHAMQALARWGRISFDPFSTDWPSRFPDPRWIDVIDRYWEEYTIKHQHTRGPGPDLFMGFHENFLASSVRELYRSGEDELAQKYLDRLNSLYGVGNRIRPDLKYNLPLEVFVTKEVQEQYEAQPHLAPSDVAASLRYAFRVGIGKHRPEVFQKAMRFAAQVTDYFKHNKYNDYVTKMGSARLGDLIGQLESSVYVVFAQLMTDSSIPLEERLTIYHLTPDEVKVPVYDDIFPEIERQLPMHPISRVLTAKQALPEPPGLEQYRRLRAVEEAREAERAKEAEGGAAAPERR